MITSNLLGGLGNYMFQITAAYSLALDNSDESKFNINDSLKVHSHLNTYLSNILRNVNIVDGEVLVKSVYSEPNFHYDKIPYKKDMRLNGYYQSEKYFNHNRDKILELYSIDKASKNYIEDKYGEVLKGNTCSIHVRRGDYLGLTNHHPPCDLGYYNKAIELFPNTKFLVISNDIEWCKEVFVGDKFIFIEDNPDYIDMWLMTLCDNNIIANSSFSWWGAWLNNNTNKRVIVPKRWFGPAITHNTKDLIPETWEII